MMEYTIRLIGPDERPARLSGALIASLFETLDRGTRGAVRLRLDGRSAAKGTPPSWLSRAAFFSLDAVEKDQAILHLSAPALGDSVAADTAQYELIPETDAAKTPLTLMSEGLSDALRGTDQTDTYDEPLLRTFETFRTVFHQGVVGFQLRNGGGHQPPLEVAPDSLDVFEALHPKTYEPRFIRLAGLLNTIRHSDKAFVLQIGAGTSVRGILQEGSQSLSQFFGKMVVVSGQALFRPTGTLLRIDATRIDPANEADQAIWSALPIPFESSIHQRDYNQHQGPRSGVNAVFGKWPKTLSKEEMEKVAALLIGSK
jgi:hypothetical protein